MRLAFLPGGWTADVEVATSPAEHAQGLAGRDWIPPHSGMLFVFETPGYYPFQMRETRVPLDILFVDAAGRVVRTFRSAPAFSGEYGVATPVKYVVELPGGTVDANGGSVAVVGVV